MTTACEKIDLIKLSTELLASQYKNSPNLIGHLQILIKSLVEIQDVYCQLIDERDIDSAIGEQLDVLGRIVGQPRSLVSRNIFGYFSFLGFTGGGGYGDFYDPLLGKPYITVEQASQKGQNVTLTDDQYRILIRAAAFRNTIRSTPDELAELINFTLTDAIVTLDKIYIVESTQIVFIMIGAILDDQTKQLLTLELNDRGRGSPSYLIPRTLGVQYKFGTYSPDRAFTYGETDNVNRFDGKNGYGDNTPGVGGTWASLF